MALCKDLSASLRLGAPRAIPSLTNTYFIEETIMVAANRAFSTDHVVYRLLSEHWQTTLSINALARSTLVPKVIVLLAPVTEKQVYKLINKIYEDVNFTSHHVPTDLTDLANLTDEFTKVGRQIDSGTNTYDVLYPESTARAIVI